MATSAQDIAAAPKAVGAAAVVVEVAVAAVARAVGVASCKAGCAGV